MADSNGRKSVLGKDFHITGELTISDDAIIEGQVDGVLRGAGQLELGETSRVTGTVIGASVKISGQAQADVVGEEDVELMPGAKMRGRVFSHRFCVNEGAGFRGEIWVDADAMQAAKQQVISQLGNAAAAPGTAPAAGGRTSDSLDVSAAELGVLANTDTLGAAGIAGVSSTGAAHGRPLRIRGSGLGTSGAGGSR